MLSFYHAQFVLCDLEAKQKKRYHFGISIAFCNLMAVFVFIAIWAYIKSASSSHLYVYEVTKICTCVHKIIKQVICV